MEAFSHLGDFGFRRSPWQAFVFYLVYFAIAMLCGVVLAMSMGVIMGVSDDKASSFGMLMGVIASVSVSTIVTFLILKNKHLFGRFSSVLFLIAAPVLAVLGGAVLGMIIPAYLSTLEKKTESIDAPQKLS